MIEVPNLAPAKQALEIVTQEYVKAVLTHKPMTSTHDGYAKILEELDELWDEVRKREPDRQAMIGEATQIGAMAIRFLVDVCGVGGTKDDG